ncbi:hypothetical protein ACHHYP_13808 [Achlya hypogyna]|uniref:Ubiquitin-like protease family profile domain-containing protein n=1 Tax=Achlya hypogyna TaxID=1202772 RepID=A0A1V9ZFD6_ACHHY|nr:hypothetical protein ACHHYP_13808 [Achlya hypogyna]
MKSSKVRKLQDEASQAFSALTSGLQSSGLTREQQDSDSDFEEVSVLERKPAVSPFFGQTRQTRFKAPKPTTRTSTRDDDKVCAGVAICSRSWGACWIFFHGDRAELEVRAQPRSLSKLALPKSNNDFQHAYIPYKDIRTVRDHTQRRLIVLDLVATSQTCIKFPADEDVGTCVVLHFEDDLTFSVVRSSLDILEKRCHKISYAPDCCRLSSLSQGTTTFPNTSKCWSAMGSERSNPVRFILLLDPADDIVVVFHTSEAAKRLTRADSRRELITPDTNREPIEIHETMSPAPAGPRTRSTKREDEKPKSQQAKDRVVVRYPLPAHSRNRITITEGDLDRLRPGEFLNDNLLDFFFKFCNAQLDASQRSIMHFFSTHFYSALAKTPAGQYQKINRWTRAVAIFEQRFLFVPVNDSCHWSLAVICHPGGLIRPKKAPEVVDVDGDDDTEIVHDSQDLTSESPPAATSNAPEGPSEVPCILYFDSLQCHNKNKIWYSGSSCLRPFLESEYESRYPDNDGFVFDATDAVLVEPDVPRQSNSCDCGVFLVLYAIEVIRRFPGGIMLKDVASACVDQMTPTMFAMDTVVEFRDYLHQLLVTLGTLQAHRVDDTKSQLRSEGLSLFTKGDNE